MNIERCAVRIKDLKAIQKPLVDCDVGRPAGRTLGAIKQFSGGDKRQEWEGLTLLSLANQGVTVEKLNDNICDQQIRWLVGCVSTQHMPCPKVYS